MKFSLLFSKNFRIPLVVLLGIIFYLLLRIDLVILAVIILGSYQLFVDAFKKLIQRHFALDYIAIVAILVSLYTHQFLIAAILALMISSGRTLDEYAANSAKRSLTKLIERVPQQIHLWINNKQADLEPVSQIKEGQQIFIRKGEVIPLDGILQSETGSVDESSLTGEPYLIDKVEGDYIRSGTLNLGNPMVVKVTANVQNSTYSKIVDLVKKAQQEKSPLIRIADKYSNFFTFVTFSLASFAYLTSNFDLNRSLAVLAIATPCPLIIATPIALIGGVSNAAKRNIIVKKLAGLEVLSRINTLIFDKTGTLTIGQPKINEFTNLSTLPDKEILSLAAGLERNSLHPLAKAVVEFAKNKKVPPKHLENIQEIVGQGISGQIRNDKFTLTKVKEEVGMSIELLKNNHKMAVFKFEDQLKADSKAVVSKLQTMGLSLHIFTGDKQEAVEKIARELGASVQFSAQMSPKDKQEGVKTLQNMGKVVGMIGDGINDAPALALADVGLVFSHAEQTAASEAADIVFLGGDFAAILYTIKISKRTIKIAVQSITVGIGLSIAGMVFASFGFVPPLFGAGLQEVIDVAVILNALRASR